MDLEGQLDDAYSTAIRASIHFLRKNAIYEQERPYLLRYLPGNQDWPQSNVELEVKQVLLQDLRHLPAPLDFERCGIQITKIDTPMRYEDFWDQLKVEQTYLESVRLHVRQALGATEVFVIPHIVETLSTTDNLTAHSTHVALYKIRKRHTMFPKSTGETYDYEQPTNVANIGLSLCR